MSGDDPITETSPEADRLEASELRRVAAVLRADGLPLAASLCEKRATHLEENRG